MSQYTPGPASGAEARKDGEKWTLILVRELRHAPEKVWQALTDPAHLHEWAPFDTDGSLGKVGTVKLTWAGTPTAIETRVTRADAPRVLGVQRHALGAGSLGRRHAADAVAESRSPFYFLGRRGLAHLFRRPGPAAGGGADRAHRRLGGDEVRRLAAAKRGICDAVRRRGTELAAKRREGLKR